MIPEEKVNTTLKVPGDIYLVDCHVFGGNSGSPMFTDLQGDRAGGISLGHDYRLLGVVSGYVPETATMEIKPVASYAGTVAANSDVATVVPAQELLDLLDSPEAKTQRDKVVASLRKQPGR